MSSVSRHLTSMEPKHIPAWKRLGLKLKNSGSLDESSVQTNGVLKNVLKRPAVDNTPSGSSEKSRPEPSNKKRRTDSRSSKSNQVNGSIPKSLDSAMKTKVNPLKKKVSFSSDSKAEDGDSARTLIADWEEDQAYQYQSSYMISSLVSTEPPKRVKEKNGPGAQVSNMPRKSKDALDYLTLYHKSRQVWKFNKNRQTWILRHALSTTDIPPDFNFQLAAYLSDLKSDVARSRLIDDCRQELDKASRDPQPGDQDDEDMENPARRKLYHDAAVRRFKRSLEQRLDEEERQAQLEDPEYLRWLSRRKRAELLLWAVSPPAEDTSESTSRPSNECRMTTSDGVSTPVKNGHASKPPQKKKKKNRTAVVDISSSSSSSSDDDDDSDSDINDSRTNGEMDSNQPSTAPRSTSAESDVSSSTTSDSEEEEEEEEEGEGDSAMGTSSSEDASSDGGPTTHTASSKPRHQAATRPISISSSTSGTHTLINGNSGSPSSRADDDGATSSDGSDDDSNINSDEQHDEDATSDSDRGSESESESESDSDSE